MKLNLEEIESLVQLQFSDLADWGNSELEIERAIADQRAKIGYCKKHLDELRKLNKNN